MSGFEIAATIDSGIRWGNEFYRLCAALKNADREVAERIVQVRMSWIRISTQMDLAKRVIDTMDDEHKEVLDYALRVVLDRLEMIRRELEKVSRTSRGTRAGTDGSEGTVGTSRGTFVSRTRYALNKSRIDNAIADIQKWQNVVDSSWFLILKIANEKVDSEVATEINTSDMPNHEEPVPDVKELRMEVKQNRPSVLLHAEGLIPAVIEQIPQSCAKVAIRNDHLLILDAFVCVNAQRTMHDIAAKDVRDLAQKLRNRETTAFGLLRCKGVVKEGPNDTSVAHGPASYTTTFTMVFTVPPKLTEPQSLRNALLAAEPSLSLSDIVEIAKVLAKSVSYVHVFGFVHKNIRPETILLLRDSGSPTGLSAFLVGFQNFRKDSGHTSRVGDNSWHKNIYRHPARYGQNPRDIYVMQHDIYSLGVCLLEIGLWSSFVRFADEPEPDTPIPGSWLNLPGSTGAAPRHYTLFKDHFLSLAKDVLPRKTGAKYAKVVETCLTCLDEHNEDFGDQSEFLDEDGVLVGVRYIEKVLLRLNDISL